MNRPSFSEGVAVAFASALGASIFSAVLPGFFGPATAARLVIAALGLAYVLYLLKRSEGHTGRVVALVIWLAVAAMAWVLVSDILIYAAAHLGLVWLVRALYHQSGPLAALMDLALNGLALTAGLWAYLNTDSVFLGVWSVFLMQALFVGIPSAKGRSRGGADSQDPRPDPFQTAYRSAEVALRRLSSHH